MHSTRRGPAITLGYIGLVATAGITPARSQNLYVSFNTSAVIQKVAPNGSNGSTFYSGGVGSSPLGLAFDASGNLYAANSGSDSIETITPGGVAKSFSEAAGSKPYDLAFDAAGDLFVANEGTNTIEEFNTTTGVGTQFASTGLSQPDGLAFDASGNLYAANSGSDSIETITPGGVASTFYSGSGVSGPLGLAFDAAGNLYVANRSSYSIEKITPDKIVSNFYTTPVSGAGDIEFDPNFLAFDKQGSLYATNNLNYQNLNGINDGRFATVVKFSPDGNTASTFYSQDPTVEHAYGLAFGAAPEPSEWAVLGFTGLGIAGMLVRGRRRGAGKGGVG